MDNGHYYRCINNRIDDGYFPISGIRPNNNTRKNQRESYHMRDNRVYTCSFYYSRWNTSIEKKTVGNGAYLRYSRIIYNMFSACICIYYSFSNSAHISCNVKKRISTTSSTPGAGLPPVGSSMMTVP